MFRDAVGRFVYFCYVLMVLAAVENLDHVELLQ